MTEERNMAAKQKPKPKQQPRKIKGKRMPVMIRDPLTRRIVKQS